MKDPLRFPERLGDSSTGPTGSLRMTVLWKEQNYGNEFGNQAGGGHFVQSAV